MARMQQIEAAIREDDFTAGEAPPVNLGKQRAPVKDLGVFGMIVVDQVADDFLSFQERDPELLDLEPPAIFPSSAASS